MSGLVNVKEKIRGPVFSIITPFKQDESIDFDVLGRYIDYLYAGGARIFYVMGYNSRFSELDYDEIKRINEYVTFRVKGIDGNTTVIVADPLHCSTKTSSEFASHAQEIGADLISLVFREKFYFEDQVIAHYSRIAENSDIGILIHEMPFISGLGGHMVDWPLSLLDRLADIDSVVAVKEDAKDDQLSEEIISVLKGRLAIIISGGGKRQWLRFAEIGCQAWLNGIGVFEPRLATAFYRCYQEGNKIGLDRIIEKIEIPFFERAVGKYGWHLAIKAALQDYGIMDRFERMPMRALDGDAYAEVSEVINSFKIEELLRELDRTAS